LNTSYDAVFFCGVSRSRLNIGTSTLLFFVPSKSENHAHISGGSLRYQVGRVQILKRSILRDAVQANLFHRLYFVVAQAAGVAIFIAAHNKSLNTGLAIRSRSLFNTGCSQPVKQTLGLTHLPESSLESIIRNAELKDIPKLCDLLTHLCCHEVSQADMKNRLAFIQTSNIDDLFVLEVNGVVKGLLGFRIRENIEEPSRYGEISVIVTDPEARKLGVGRSLMEYAENLAKTRECKGTWLVSGFGREEEAHIFYKNLGYKITGYRFVKE